MNHQKNRGPELAFDSYVAVALQPRIYGCRNRDDIKKNMKNQLSLLDSSIGHAFLVGGGPVKLVAFAEGSIQGFWDEISHMDQATYCKELAIRIPGEETDQRDRGGRSGRAEEQPEPAQPRRLDDQSRRARCEVDQRDPAEPRLAVAIRLQPIHGPLSHLCAPVYVRLGGSLLDRDRIDG